MWPLSATALAGTNLHPASVMRPSAPAPVTPQRTPHPRVPAMAAAAAGRTPFQRVTETGTSPHRLRPMAAAAAGGGPDEGPTLAPNTGDEQGQASSGSSGSSGSGSRRQAERPPKLLQTFWSLLLACSLIAWPLLLLSVGLPYLPARLAPPAMRVTAVMLVLMVWQGGNRLAAKWEQAATASRLALTTWLYSAQFSRCVLPDSRVEALNVRYAKDPARLASDVAGKHIDYVSQLVFVAMLPLAMFLCFPFVWLPLRSIIAAAHHFEPSTDMMTTAHALGFGFIVGRTYFAALSATFQKKRDFDELAAYKQLRDGSISPGGSGG